ncbi:MAG: hypothetical protein JWP57_234 [Spirosoma sp.]|nr:hypothetical protein [Spirosoma sp.]
MSQSFQELQAFIAENTARKPRTARKKGEPKPESANQLTRRIVSHIRKNGGFASRISSTGTYRADLKKFVPSQQVSGLPDVTGVLNGRSLWVEIKVARDQLSEAQKQTISGLIKAGACTYIARDFEGFLQWFTALQTLPSDAECIPFGPAKSI